MQHLELLYFPGCPHLDAARAHLTAAFVQLNQTGAWTEWDITAGTTPAHRRTFASPTVLLNGVPVGDGGPAAERSCVRSGAPTVAQLVAALHGQR